MMTRAACNHWNTAEAGIGAAGEGGEKIGEADILRARAPHNFRFFANPRHRML